MCFTGTICINKFYKLGLTASLAVRLIGLWLVIASQKDIHNV